MDVSAPAQIITAPAQIITAPAQLITAPAQLITAPAQPPATGVVVYTALFSKRLLALLHICTCMRLQNLRAQLVISPLHALTHL